MGHSRRLISLKTTDLGLFGATWWPHASFERLKIATYLVGWVRTQPINFIRTES